MYLMLGPDGPLTDSQPLLKAGNDIAAVNVCPLPNPQPGLKADNELVLGSLSLLTCCLLLSEVLKGMVAVKKSLVKRFNLLLFVVGSNIELLHKHDKLVGPYLGTHQTWHQGKSRQQQIGSCRTAALETC